MENGKLFGLFSEKYRKKPSGLPFRALRAPTVEELRAVEVLEEDPRETVGRLRRTLPLAGPDTLEIVVRY